MQTIHSRNAPGAIGSYTQAICTGNLLFCSGQTPVNPQSMKIEERSIAGQTTRAIKNLELVLLTAGLTLHDVVKTNIYLCDMENFQEMNAAYAKCFGVHKPARTTVAVKGLPLAALIEIECIAEFKNPPL
ncbi:MAG: RidA family protein [Rhizobacter sp.]|nr:RidA family protein [Ferruginibacter sp.]